MMSSNTAPKTVLVTGGAGFIGSTFLQHFVSQHPETHFICLDKLSYAGSKANIDELESLSNFQFVQIDLVIKKQIDEVLREMSPDWVFHFAAETHVDRSIKFPLEAIQANVLGTANLLESLREKWGNFEGKRFIHVSTDEVYGSIQEGLFTEASPYDPSSPYSASKAGSDHIVRAYNRTYGFPSTVTNCTNNYGPRQHPEKLIPLMIFAAAEGRDLPVYGDGSNLRDWMFAEDHVEGLWKAAQLGQSGETYLFGGAHELTNLQMVHAVADEVARQAKIEVEEVKSRIRFVGDRPGHDFRYALDSKKTESALGWSRSHTFDKGLEMTVSWYLSHKEWADEVRGGEYANWVDLNYTQRISN